MSKITGTLLMVAGFAWMAAPAPAIDFVLVGNPGNAADTLVNSNDMTTGYGAVDYVYRMGTKEITNDQYVEFMNAVDPTGANALGLMSDYELFLGDPNHPASVGIELDAGASDGLQWKIIAGKEGLPVSYVSMYDGMRFCNWLHNGQGSGDTEDGAYTLLGGTPRPSNGEAVTRNPGAKWFLPSEDEWYKAAYHKNDGVTGNYWLHATGTDEEPYSAPPPGTAAPDPSNTVNYRNDGDDPNDGYNDGHAVTGSPALLDNTNYKTAPCSYPQTTSPYGCFDMAGSQWEWTEGEAGVSGRGNGVWRGGSWDNKVHSIGAIFRRGCDPQTHEFGTTGFRVATVAAGQICVQNGLNGYTQQYNEQINWGGWGYDNNLTAQTCDDDIVSYPGYDFPGLGT
jgi:sulfatase modifying factor 1